MAKRTSPKLPANVISLADVRLRRQVKSSKPEVADAPLIKIEITLAGRIETIIDGVMLSRVQDFHYALLEAGRNSDGFYDGTKRRLRRKLIRVI